MARLQQPTEQRSLYSIAVQFFINGMIPASYVPRLPEIRDLLNIDLSTVGQILTIASLAGLFGSWLAGKVINRIGTKKSMIYGSVAVICTLPLIAQASTVWMLFLVLALIMMLDPIVDVAMNIQGSNLSARREVPVMNRLHGFWSVGAVVGGLISAGMAAMTISLQWHLMLTATIMALGLFYISRGLLETGPADSESTGSLPSKSHTIRTPISLWVFAVLGFTVFIPELIGSEWGPFRLTDDLQASAGMAGFAYVSFTVGMVIGRLSGDWAAVRLSKSQLLNYAVVVAVLGLATACLVDVTPLVFIGLCIAGIGVSTLFPTLYDAAAQSAKNPSAALGVVTAGARVASLIAPVSIGLLADVSWLSVGLVMATFSLPSLVIVAFLARRNLR